MALLLPLCLQVLVPACGGQSEEKPAPAAEAGPLVPAQGQRIVFERNRNRAMPWSIKGLFITADGEVYGYDYLGANPDAGPPDDLGVHAGMTEAQLSEKYGASPTLIATVDRDTLLQKFAMLAEARRGTLVSKVQCADAGQESYFGYLYDASTGTYTPVPLGDDGDWSMFNTVVEARQLKEWIRAFGGSDMVSFCTYQTSSCEGQACAGAAACPDGQVPAIPTGDAGCLESCSAPSACESVESCSICAAASSSCLVDGAGGYHCIGWTAGCAGEPVTCECGAEDLCAGGAAFCKGSPETGISCAVK